jgi:uncharacterized delta-60 repeat protein
MRAMRRELALAAGLLLALAAPAAAKPQGEPVRFWSISNVRQGVGEQEVTGGAQIGGALRKTVRLGVAAFNFPDSPVPDRAVGLVTSSADGRHYSVQAQAPVLNPFEARSPKGGAARLHELHAFEKTSGDASLKITITQAIVEAIDDNHALGADECPVPGQCRPIRAVVRFHARAYAESAGGDFFTEGGTAFVEGHQGRWNVDAVTSSDSAFGLWDFDDFRWVADEDDPSPPDPGVHMLGELEESRTIRVPLRSVHEGELFALDVGLEAVAIDDRGRESAAEALIVDPQGKGPALLATHGLRERGKPHFKAPRAKAPRAARCSRRAQRSGTVGLSEAALAGGEGSGVPTVLVGRTGGARGAASVEVRTRAGSASAGRDFKRRSTRVRFAGGDASPRLVEVPILEDAAQEAPETLTVELDHPRCVKLGRRSATLTILDDDAAPAQPPPAAPAPVATPAPPTPPPPPGLDASFGDGGRVSTPVGGGDAQGEAVVIQPDGTIATAGRAGTPTGFDFALTRHDASGRLLGVTTTDLGTQDDEASGAALLPGGGIVAAGRTLSGPVDYDVALVRYRPDGTLDPDFGVDGIVKTDVAGSGDVADAVAVQPDGKILVAGSSASGVLADGDLLLARYLPDGTLDPSFDHDGIVTTDLGTRSDDARALLVRPGGGIVVAGTAGDDVALARYLPDGTLDGAPTISDFGSDDVADGVALAPDGSLLIAGFTLGPAGDRDFLLARYSAEGTLGPSVTTGFGGGDDFATDLVVDAAGRIVVVGRATSATILDLALVRYRSDLTLDPGFGSGGRLTVDFHGKGDLGEDVALDAAGRIVAAGLTATGTRTELALVRANP